MVRLQSKLDRAPQDKVLSEELEALEDVYEEAVDQLMGYVFDDGETPDAKAFASADDDDEDTEDKEAALEEEEDVDEEEDEEEDDEDEEDVSGFEGLPDVDANLSDDEVLDFDVEDDYDILSEGQVFPTQGKRKAGASEELASIKKTMRLDSATEEESEAKEDPLSFSQISVQTLHRHLGLVENEGDKKETSAELEVAGAPYVTHLAAGEMLYLPASWWHEVSSQSSTAGDVHMALNYWFHPPNDLKKMATPYADALIWDYRREVVSREVRRLTQ